MSADTRMIPTFTRMVPALTRLVPALALVPALVLIGCRDDPPVVPKRVVDPLVVETEQGHVRGQQQGQVHVFRGLPYAAAPSGALRFRPPAAPRSWAGIRDATAYGPRCPQRGLSGDIIGDEDCLNLNIWRPASVAQHPRPVLVFIHGGANAIGSGADPLNNGRALADQHDVIIVTINYRLGLLGFLAHPALTQDSGTSGNWAHLDQIAALDWIAHNIAAFGGDPERVTIFGESAGASSVCVLLASPLAAGLFAGAIMQSGSCDVPTLAQREQDGEQIVDSVCADAKHLAACMRAMPATTWVGLAPSTQTPGSWALDDGMMPLAGAVDGYLLPASPWQMFEAGSHTIVPTLVGSNADETELFIPRELHGCDAYQHAVAASFGALSEAVLAAYPCSDDAHARDTLVQVTTDAFFACPARRALRALATASTPVFRYHYAYTRADPAVHELRAFHGAELQLLFGTMHRLGYELPEPERELAEIMQTSWVGLASSGSPVHARTPGWQRYDSARDNAVIFDAPVITSADKAGTARCDVWDRLLTSSPAPDAQPEPATP